MKEKPQKNKIEWQRKTYPLKLKLTEEQESKLIAFLEEYQRITNFIINKCVNELYPTYKQKYKQPPYPIGNCFLCNKQKNLKYEVKLPSGKKIKNCGCFNGHYSLRKIFLPSKNYTLKKFYSKPEYDIRFQGKLYDGYPKLIQGGDKLNGETWNRSLYDSCLQKAVETVKSQEALNKKIEYNINYLFHNNTLIQKIINKESIKKENKIQTEKLKKYSTKKLKKFLTKNQHKLKRLKNQKAEKVEFKALMARIYEQYYSWIKDKNEFKLQLNLFEKPMTIDFYGKDYQKKKAKKFSEQERQPEIELLKRGKNFFIQYIYRKQTPTKKLDDSFTAIGIDLGILNHYSIACQKKDSKKPFLIKFWNGRPLRRKRRQYYKIRRIWQKKTKSSEKGGKNKSKGKGWLQKKFDSQNEKQFVKTELHKVSTSLAHFIYNNIEKPVIILEDLKNIRNTTKKMNASHKKTLQKKLKGTTKKYYLKERYLNKELNSWNFKELHEFLKYKLEWLGIPTIVVSAKNTSIECNKCGHIDEKNYANLHELKFKCLNCGYECNVDFNASVNLSKKFFEEQLWNPNHAKLKN